MKTWFWRAVFEKGDQGAIVSLRGGVVELPDGYDEETVEVYIKDRIFEEYGVQNSKCIVHIELDDDHPGDEP